MFDPTDPSFRADPYPVYERLREEAPVHRGALGAWFVARYDDCARLLASPACGKDFAASSFFQDLVKEGDPPPFAGLGMTGDARPFFLSDPPYHTRLRRLVSQAFTRSAATRLEPLIAELISIRLDEAERNGSFDPVAGLGASLAVRVLSALLGVPDADAEQFRTWSREIAGALEIDFTVTHEVAARRQAAFEEFGGFFASLAERRRSDPGDDLISALLAARDSSDALNTAEIASTCVTIMVAAQETMENLVGNGMLAFARHPGQYALLRERPDLAASAVEEVLRYEPPAHEVGRIALERVQIGEVVAEPGEAMLLLIGAANRDPRRFPDPENFDITRDDHGHLAYGLGIHFCLGAPLARLMAANIFAAVAARFATIECPGTPRFKDGFGLRGPEAVPLKCG